MAKASSQFSIPASYDLVQKCFSFAIEHWVVNIQSKTSALTKAVITGSAIEYAQQGHGFAAGLTLGLPNGQGVQHPTPTKSIIQIPASMTTFGGEMTATAVPDRDGETSVSIDGKVQGLLSGAAKENVNSLRDYLIIALPDYCAAVANQTKEAVPNSLASEIQQLVALRDSGALSEDEFNKAKQKLLG